MTVPARPPIVIAELPADVVSALARLQQCVRRDADIVSAGTGVAAKSGAIVAQMFPDGGIFQAAYLPPAAAAEVAAIFKKYGY